MPLTWRTLLTHWKAYSTALGRRNNVAPYVEDFTIVRSRCFESSPLTWRTLQPLWEAYSVSRHIGPERQTCPLRGGLYDHFGKLIPVFHNHMVGTEIVSCHSVRGHRGFAHGETALASHTGKPWTKFPDVPETGNVRDNNNNNNNKRHGLGRGRAPPLLAQNAHRVADKTVSSIIYLV